MSKRLSDEDVERIAAKVAEKISRPVQISPPHIHISPQWAPTYVPSVHRWQVWN